MAELLTLPAIQTMLVLIVLNIVLGVDNNLFIALQSNKVAANLRTKVRKQGIILASLLRVVLLFALLWAIQHWTGHINIDFSWVSMNLNFKFSIFLLGGLFMFITGAKELSEMVFVNKYGADIAHDSHGKVYLTQDQPYWKVLCIIIGGNVIFSADSILSAIPFAEGFTQMAWIILIPTFFGAAFMYIFADKIASFIKKSIAYEIIGLYILFLVGVLLLTEAAHVADLTLFDWHVPAMEKESFYFSIVSLAVVQAVRDTWKIQYNIVPVYVLSITALSILLHIAEHFHAGLFGIEIHDISKEAFYLAVCSLSVVHMLQNYYKKKEGLLPEIPTLRSH